MDIAALAATPKSAQNIRPELAQAKLSIALWKVDSDVIESCDIDRKDDRVSSDAKSQSSQSAVTDGIKSEVGMSLDSVDFPLHYVPKLGFCSTIGKIRVATSPPTVPEVGGGTESARLLDMGPGAWTRSLSCAQSVNVACQLHRDVCLVTSNLNILDQYDLCLQGTATKLLELTWGRPDFPSAAVDAAPLLPRVPRASTHNFFLYHNGFWRLAPCVGRSGKLSILDGCWFWMLEARLAL